MKMNEILRQAVDRQASDLLITTGRPPVLRIDGELEPQTEYPVLDSSSAQRLIFEIVPENRRRQLEEALELDFSYAIPNVSRFRVNVYYRDGGMAAAIRTIPTKIPTLGELRLPPIEARERAENER